MATSHIILMPEAASFPSSNNAALAQVNLRKVLAFDAGTDESCFWAFHAPQALAAGALSLVVSYIMASATTGTIDFEGDVEAVTSGDAFDLDAGDSFDTANTMTADTVPGTAGYMKQFAITLTNKDSIAVGDLVRVRLRRDADDVSNDTAAGDCYVLAAEVREA